MSILSNLTERQLSIFEFIRDKIQKRGYGPTVREIGESFEIQSPNGVMCHLRALENKGLIVRARKKSRAIELSSEVVAEEKGLPLVGCVAAGVMHEAIEQTERVDFAEMFHHKDYFALEVKGDSMIDAHIAEGDLVIVRRQKNALAGQMVVAQAQGEATLKYWHPEAGRVRLQPANAAMSPLYVKQAEVLGVVVGVVRRVR